MFRLRIPTYDDAKNIVSEKGNTIFYEIKHKINGVNLSVFNYRYPSYTDFLDNDVDFREMRGLTFVFNDDGSYKRYVLLKKFWNINQVPESMYDMVKDYKLLSSYNKEDGSVISFIKINEEIIPKSKMGFDNDQVIKSGIVYNSNRNIKQFVEYCFDNDIVSIWEYVSFKNKIVLDYDKDNLILLRLRDNKTGDYIDIEEYRNMGFDVAEQDNITIEDAMLTFPNIVDKEGTVFTLQSPNGEKVMVKKKTDWYLLRHNLLTNDINKENYVIHSILDNTIDDIISQLETTDITKREFIEDIQNIVNFKISMTVREVKEFLKKYEGDKKSFSLEYGKHPLFHFAIGYVNGIDLFEMVTLFFTKKTSKLHNAQKWLEKSRDEYEKS